MAWRPRTAHRCYCCVERGARAPAPPVCLRAPSRAEARLLSGLEGDVECEPVIDGVCGPVPVPRQARITEYL